MSNHAIIHCQPSVLNYVRQSNMNWSNSSDHDVNEIDIFVDNIPSLNNEEFCSHYGINYDLVNSIEFI